MEKTKEIHIGQVHRQLMVTFNCASQKQLIQLPYLRPLEKVCSFIQYGLID